MTLRSVGFVMIRSNPFFFESPSDRWSFTDREQLTKELTAFLAQRGSRLLVHGLRRVGKTSLLLHAGRITKGRFVFVDVSASTSLNEIAQKLLEEAPAAEESLLPKLLRLAKTHFSSVTIDAGGFKLSGELRPEEGAKNLEAVLSYLNSRAGAEDTPWTICLDEFQDIKILGGERVDWKIRSFIQQHKNLNYIFSGSDYRLVQWMTEPSAAFFKQLQLMEVGPIEPEILAKWIAERAKIGGLSRFPFGLEIIEKAGPRTGDVIRLAMVCFEIVALGKTPDAAVVSKAFDLLVHTQMASEFFARWHDCTLVQRGLLRALAQGYAPTASVTIKRFGLRATSTAASALDGLIKKQILARLNGGNIAFDNPFFKHWCFAQGVNTKPTLSED